MTTRRTYTLEARALVTVKVNAESRSEARRMALEAMEKAIRISLAPGPQVNVTVESTLKFSDSP